MRLTENQKKEVCDILQNLRSQLGDREAATENVAAAMLEFCENLDMESASELCGRIREGAEGFYRICADERVLTEPDFAERMLEKITEQMDSAQRKGFFLQSLDAFEKYQASADETAGRAALSGEELKGMLADRIREFSETVVSGIRDSIAGSAVQGRKETAVSGDAAGSGTGSDEKADCPGEGEAADESVADIVVKKELLEEAFLYAVAEYIAGINGVLPREFGAYPELLGICAASQRTLLWYCEVYEEEEDKADTARAIRNVLCAAAGAALLFGAAVVGVAAESVLATMEVSALGIIIFSLSCVTIACMCLAGGALLLCSIFTVIDECTKVYGERSETETPGTEYTDSSVAKDGRNRGFRADSEENGVYEETAAFNCTV